MTKPLLRARRKAALWLGGIAVVSGLASAALVMQRSSSAPVVPATRWIPVHPEPLTVRLGLVGRLEAESTLTITAPFDATVQDLSLIHI